MDLALLTLTLCLYVGRVELHEAYNYPPGVPSPSQQQGHPHPVTPPSSGFQGQPPGQGQGQNLQFQGGQQNQQQGQFQDPNVQHMQQQQPPQQQQGQGHHHGGGFRQQQDIHNAEHIKEHLKEVIDKPKEQMTEEELEFHYFKLHDYDGNNKLDGTEITKAITHYHHEEGDQKTDKKVFTDKELVNIVDLVLKEDDLNNDGYVEYAEFVTAQRAARDKKD